VNLSEPWRAALSPVVVEAAGTKNCNCNSAPLYRRTACPQSVAVGPFVAQSRSRPTDSLGQSASVENHTHHDHIITILHSASANLRQRQHFIQKWSGIRIRGLPD